MSHKGPGNSSPSNQKALVEAMSLLSLTNTCFKNCVMKNTPKQLISGEKHDEAV